MLLRIVKEPVDRHHSFIKMVLVNLLKQRVMNTEISQDIQDVIKAVHYHPAISIIMPFDPKMGIKAELQHQLKLAIDKVEKAVMKEYNDDLADLVMLKLKNIAKNLNFNTYKKSIAIYVSPVFEKVFYLDIEVEEKIIIDESFEIRDLIYARKEMHRFMVLVLSGRETKVYLSNGSRFAKVKSNVPDDIAAFENDLPERTGNFSDPPHHKEVLLKKFLRETDHGLSFLLKSYQLPVFVAGTDKVLGYFKAITKNEVSIMGYIPGNYEESTEAELDVLLEPYVNDWKKIKMEELKLQMEKAAGAGKLATGIIDVWKQAVQHKGQLLIVEKNFMFAAEKGSAEEMICKPAEPYNKFSCIKDAVDDLIEKVLQDGGDVEFVDDGMLNDYGRIVLIKYY
jgi:Bacterial archaeo-eukaryotic release factor family 3